MKTPFHYLMIAGLLVAAIVRTATADVLLTDNFNVVSGNSQDVNQDILVRQSGPLAPATYDGWAVHHQVGNTGTDVGQPGGYATYGGGYVLVAFSGSFFSDLDVASLCSGPLTIEFDMFQQTSASGDWAGFGLRFPGSSWPVAGAGEFGFLRRLNGGMQVFQNNSNIAPANWDTAGFAPTNHWRLIFSDTNGTGSAFNGHGSQVTIINGTAWTNTIVLSQLNSRDLRFGWTTSGNSDSFCGIDNLVVSGTLAPSIPNLSFEQDAIGTGNIAAFTGWHRFIGQNGLNGGAVGGSGGDIGSEYPTAAEYAPNSPMNPPADGNQYLFVNMTDTNLTGGVYQDVGPMIPNHTYNLVVAIGSRGDRINSPGIISLVNGTDNLGTVLVSSTNLPATQNTWQDYSVQYTTGPSVSGDLTICLSVAGAGTIQANFDNVRLDPNTNAPPVPFFVQNTLPTYAETVEGDQVVFSTVVSNSPAANLQWLMVTNGVTNIVSGATGATLTLSNVTTQSSGYYLLEAVNATNGAAVAYSVARQLVVNTNPAAVNGVVVQRAGQTFPGYAGYVPTWPVDTNDLNLIYGFQSFGSGPGTISFLGDFTGGGNFCNADPAVMTDGMIDILTNLPNLAYCACGTLNRGVGYQVTYWLQTNAAPYGLDLTNITVFSGWQDAGRNEQKYQVLYSTVQDPSTFAPLVLADYPVTDSANSPFVARTTLVPASGVLAHNVAALRISWNVSPEPKNGWTGYSEILAGGQPSTGFVPALSSDVTPNTASDVVGGQLVLTAGFANYTTLQWQHNGTNLPGATASTLTLSNLQLGDSGGYSLVASNAIGGNSSSACVVTVNTNGLATNNILLAIAGQTSIADVFTPTWDASGLTSSLLYGAYPSDSGEGDFTGGSFNLPTAGSGPSVLTDGTYGTVDFNNTGTHYNWTCMGSGTSYNAGPLLGGQYVTYTLPASANGYDLTNIMVAAGWNDFGRDQQAYTVRYATTANPTYFMPLTVVNYNPASPVGYSVNRATITAANGVLASNVVALQFDMSTPGGENGFSGYSEMAAYGSPSVNPAPEGLQITVQHEESDTNLVNIWTPETPNLIANQLPSSFSSGVFTGEGCTEAGLTDGILSYGGNANSASCGSTNSGAVSWIVFNATSGWDLTNIVFYSLWHDYGRDDQYYDVSYSTLTAPATFLPLTSIRVNPPVPHDGTASGNRVQIAPMVGQTYLATNVAAVKFDFSPHAGVDYEWSGVTEIILQGTNLPAAIVPTLPTTFSAPQVSGGNLILTGTGGTPTGYSYTWLSTTNLTPPVIWTTNVQGTLDGTGSFSNAIPVNPGPATFFRFRMP